VEVNIELLKAELTRDEDRRLKPYFDSVGKLTIGVGRNLDDVGISADESNYLLEADIGRVCDELDATLPWWRNLDETRQRVIANMAFNLGVPRLMGFKNTLRYLQDRNYEEAAREMLASKWADQVGARAIRLAKLMRDA
jgi:lysozyme